MKTRRLTKEEHTARLSSGVCPRCGDYRLVRVVRTKEGDRGRPQFAGSFYACGGPDSHQCYHLSGDGGATLSESADGTDPVRLRTTNPNEPSRVIRRVKPADQVG